MQKQLPKEIKEARDLFVRFEKEADHSLRTEAFAKAMDILDDYLAVEPETDHKVFIQNIKRTYTRKLLEELHVLPGLDIATWLQYMQLLSLKAPNEVDFNLEKTPQLNKDYKKFTGIWRDEIIKWANRS